MVNKKGIKTKALDKPKRKSDSNTLDLVNLVVKGMQEKKGHSIMILDLREIKTAVADFFVLCSANTDTQIDAIRHSVEEVVWKELKQDVWMKEGLQNKEWILLDFADVVAHIFRTDRREFYGLEDLWGDAIITNVDEEDKIPGIKSETKKEKNTIKKAKPSTAKKADAKKKVEPKKKTVASKNNKTKAKTSTVKKKTTKK